MMLIALTALVACVLAVWVFSLRFFRNDILTTLCWYDYPAGATVGAWSVVILERTIVLFVVTVMVTVCLAWIRRTVNGPRKPPRKRRRLARIKTSLHALRERLANPLPNPV